MKKLLIVLGSVFAGIIILLLIAAIIFIPRTLVLDKKATQYIAENTPAVVDGWNPQNLIDRASPELLSSVKSREAWDRLFAFFRQLGSLKHLDPAKGAVISGAYSGQGMYTIGNYTVQAVFEKGSAVISVQLLRVGTTWKINGFHINSDAFLPPKAQSQGAAFNLLSTSSK
jgi:hypothetical protein